MHCFNCESVPHQHPASTRGVPEYLKTMYKHPMHKKCWINALKNQIDLKRIQHFMLLSEELHFSRGAARANLTQTAFSRSIQSLEADLQLRLFDRGTRTVELTAAGRQMLVFAHELLNTARNLKAEADYLAKAEGGELRFGTSRMTTSQLLPLVLKELRELSPKLKLDIEINHGESLGMKLLGEEIEFFVASAELLRDDPRYKIMPLRAEPTSFFCRNDHPLAIQQDAVSHEQLLAYPWASVRFDIPAINLLCQLFNVPSDKQLPLSLNCSDLGVLRETLYSSDTLLATWSSWLQDDLQQGRIIDLQSRIEPALSTPPTLQDCSIVQLAGRTLSPNARRAIQLFCKHGQTIPTGN
ncbi:LysR family transcriptional regulator [Pseudomonas aeruginosa]|nr:LysR family transcriptional regulator [Pseudomonas aeruginosa]